MARVFLSRRHTAFLSRQRIKRRRRRRRLVILSSVQTREFLC